MRRWRPVALIKFVIFLAILSVIMKRLHRNNEVVNDLQGRKLNIIFALAERSFSGVIKLAKNDKVVAHINEVIFLPLSLSDNHRITDVTVSTRAKTVFRELLCGPIQLSH